jgi:hypothetical protein
VVKTLPDIQFNFAMKTVAGDGLVGASDNTNAGLELDQRLDGTGCGIGYPLPPIARRVRRIEDARNSARLCEPSPNNFPRSASRPTHAGQTIARHGISISVGCTRERSNKIATEENGSNRGIRAKYRPPGIFRCLPGCSATSSPTPDKWPWDKPPSCGGRHR